MLSLKFVNFPKVPTMNGFPSLIKALLVTSLMLTIGRGITLPFMTIYLAEHLQLTTQWVGLVLGISLTLAIFTSFYGGYLVDKFSKRPLILICIALFSISLFLLPLYASKLWVIVFLAVLNSAYSILGIAIKACYADYLPVERRIKAFSANYTLVNVGWAIGPPLGVVAATSDSLSPFVISGLIAGLAATALGYMFYRWGMPQPLVDEQMQEAPQRLTFRQTAAVLRQDKRLIYFTLGSTLGAMVFAQFAGYLSQYLITVADTDFAYKVIGAVMPVNAGIVITLQYVFSKRLNQQNLMRWLVVGSAFFMVGLAGFMLAQHSIPLWMLAMAIFSLGEIIVIPVEYLFIDYIAPPHLKGSYYGVQNLSNLGGALVPVVSGFVLAYTLPEMLFVVLMFATLVGLALFWRGYQLAKAHAVPHA